MKTLDQYPISFPYGATTPPYSPGHAHRGDDRAAPGVTPILVEGVQIGLVGTTGLSTGNHTHLQEWQGNMANTRKPQNWFKGGTVTAATQSSDFGNYVTITRDGWNDTYAHLSRIDVKIGDIIGTMEPKFNEGDRSNWNSWLYHEDKKRFGNQIGQGYKDAVGGIFLSPEYNVDAFINGGDLENIFPILVGHPPTQADKDAWIGRTWKQFVYDKVLPEVAELRKQLDSKYKPYSGEQLFTEVK